MTRTKPSLLHMSLALLLLASPRSLPAQGAGGQSPQQVKEEPSAIRVVTGESLPSGLRKVMEAWSGLGAPRDLVLCASPRTLWLVLPTAGRIAQLDSEAEEYDESLVQLVAEGSMDQPTSCAGGSGAGELVLMGKAAVWTVKDGKAEDHIPLPFFGKDVAEVGGDLWISAVPVLPAGAKKGRLPGSHGENDPADEEEPMLIRLEPDGDFTTLEGFPEDVQGDPDPLSAIASQYVRSPLIVSGKRRVFTVDPLTFEIKEYSKAGTFKGILREGSSERQILQESPEAVAAAASNAGLVPQDGQPGVVVKPAVVDACAWEGYLLVLETVTDPDGSPALTVVSTDDARSRSFTFSKKINPYRIAATRDLIVMWTHKGTFAVIEGDTLEDALGTSPEGPGPSDSEDSRRVAPEET